MIIIGELINASRKAISVAIEAGDANTIQKEAKDQTEAGADFKDEFCTNYIAAYRAQKLEMN